MLRLSFREPTFRAAMRATLLAFYLAAASLHAGAPVDPGPLKKWIERQDEFRSVQADFTQTRALRSLRSPVATPGRLWFSTPDSLRWELGSPAKTIVLKNGGPMLIIQPAKKKAARHTATPKPGAESSPDRAFAMMRFPLAKDYADFQRQFELTALISDDERCHIEMLPRDAQARRFVAAMKIDFAVKSGHLLVFEIALRDGSSLRNEFTNVRVNQKFDRGAFDYDLTGYDVTDAKP